MALDAVTRFYRISLSGMQDAFKSFGTETTFTSDTVQTFLRRSYISDIESRIRPLTILPDNTTVEHALRALSEGKILSAPIVASSTRFSTPGNSAYGLVGFLDIRDVMCSFLREVTVKVDGISNLLSLSLLQRMRLLEDSGLEFSQTLLTKLYTIGSDGNFMSASEARKSSLLHFINAGLLVGSNSRGCGLGETAGCVVHRIAIVGETGDIESIISQSDIIRYLSHHMNTMGPIREYTVQALTLGSQPVEVVGPGTSALEAMHIMISKDVSSLGVVDHCGRLIGDFSASELRTITSGQFGALALPVGDFLALKTNVEYVLHNAHAKELKDESGTRFVLNRRARLHKYQAGEEVGQVLITCTLQDTFEQVVSKLSVHKLHRLYVVDQAEAPVGVITCTDILRKLVEVAAQ